MFAYSRMTGKLLAQGEESTSESEEGTCARPLPLARGRSKLSPCLCPCPAWRGYPARSGTSLCCATWGSSRCPPQAAFSRRLAAHNQPSSHTLQDGEPLLPRRCSNLAQATQDAECFLLTTTAFLKRLRARRCESVSCMRTRESSYSTWLLL